MDRDIVQKLNVSNAEKSAWSMNNILVPAHMVTMASEIDATGLERLRTLAKTNGYKAPSYTAIMIKAAAIIMKANPQANRAVLGLPFFKSLYQFTNTDICVAVEKELPLLPGMAFAPLIKKTFEKSLAEITQELQFIAKCDETNHKGYAEFQRILKYVPRPLSTLLINLPSLLPFLWPKYRGCAAWVNSPSKAGADFVSTTWPWPITFSFGVVKKRPFVIEDKVEARLTIPLVLVFDRRVMGGGPASRLFADFQKLLKDADVVFGDEYAEKLISSAS